MNKLHNLSSIIFYIFFCGSEMKMMQMRALVNQYIDSEIATLEDCQITKDYW